MRRFARFISLALIAVSVVTWSTPASALRQTGMEEGAPGEKTKLQQALTGNRGVGQRTRVATRGLARGLEEAAAKYGPRPFAVGVRLGGNNVASGLVNKEGEVEISTSLPEANWRKKFVGDSADMDDKVAALVREGGPNARAMADQITQEVVDHVVASVRNSGLDTPDYIKNFRHVSIAFAGPVDPQRGLAGVPFAAPNVPGFDAYPLAQRVRDGIREALGVEVTVQLINDADAGLMGEISPAGAAAGVANVISFIWGTGMNGAARRNGQPFNGEGTFVELGHALVGRQEADGWHYEFRGFELRGQRPTLQDGELELEQRLAGDVIEARLASLGYAGGGPEVAQRARPDNPSATDRDAARAAIRDIGTEMGRGMAALLAPYIQRENFVPERFVLVSGVSENFARGLQDDQNRDFLLGAIQDAVLAELTTRFGISADVASRAAASFVRSGMDYRRELAAAAEALPASDGLEEKIRPVRLEAYSSPGPRSVYKLTRTQTDAANVPVWSNVFFHDGLWDSDEKMYRSFEDDGAVSTTTNQAIVAKKAGQWKEIARRHWRQGLSLERSFLVAYHGEARRPFAALAPLRGISGNAIGQVSQEASALITDKAALVAAMRDIDALFGATSLVKLPNLQGSTPGLPNYDEDGPKATRERVEDGLSGNITLGFSVQHYLAHCRAHVEGLKARVTKLQGQSMSPAAIRQDISGINWVFSLFMSRIDRLLAPWFDEAIAAARGRQDEAAAAELELLKGKSSVALGRLSGQVMQYVYGIADALPDDAGFLTGEERAEIDRLRGEFEALHRDFGARPLNLLIASSGRYDDQAYATPLQYVLAFLGPGLWNTLPPATLTALADFVANPVRGATTFDLAALAGRNMAQESIPWILCTGAPEWDEAILLPPADRAVRGVESKSASWILKRTQDLLLAGRPNPKQNSFAAVGNERRDAGAADFKKAEEGMLTQLRTWREEFEKIADAAKPVHDRSRELIRKWLAMPAESRPAITFDDQTQTFYPPTERFDSPRRNITLEQARDFLAGNRLGVLQLGPEQPGQPVLVYLTELKEVPQEPYVSAQGGALQAKIDAIPGLEEDAKLLARLLSEPANVEALAAKGYVAIPQARGQQAVVIPIRPENAPPNLQLQLGLQVPTELPAGIKVSRFSDQREQARRDWRQEPPAADAVFVWNTDLVQPDDIGSWGQGLVPATAASLLASPAFPIAGGVLRALAEIARRAGVPLEIMSITYKQVGDQLYAIVRSA